MGGVSYGEVQYLSKGLSNLLTLEFNPSQSFLTAFTHYDYFRILGFKNLSLYFSIK